MAKQSGPASNISLRRQNARAEGSLDYARKRSELVAIAAALFKEHGFKATTLADIAERAGLDRATVYYYVGSKQELFQASIEGSLDDNLSAAEGLLEEQDRGSIERIMALLAVLMRSYDRSYPQLYVYIQEQVHQVGNDTSRWSKEMQRKTRRLEAIVRELLERGIKRGELRGDLDARVAVKGLFGMLNWTHRWYRPGSEDAPEAIAGVFGRIFFEGMGKR